MYDKIEKDIINCNIGNDIMVMLQNAKDGLLITSIITNIGNIVISFFFYIKTKKIRNT